MSHDTVFERNRPAEATVTQALAGSEHKMFWLEDITRSSFSSLTGETRADLTVVGGG